MWTALVVLAAAGAGPAQAGELTLSRVRSTHGVLGPRRPEDRLLPGDSLVLNFEAKGVQPDEAGKVQYSMALEVTDASGKSLFKQVPQNLEATASLGGDSIPAYARVDVGVDQPPGTYTAKATVTDRRSGRAGALTRKFTVLEKGFGLVRLSASADPEGQLPAPALGVGQTLWLQCGAVGFRRGDGGQPNLRFEVRVLGESGEPALAKPQSSVISKDVPEKFVAVPVAFPLSLNRPGKFTVELSATDQVSGKSAKLSFPVNVQGGGK